jgi:hypothetical protein
LADRIVGLNDRINCADQKIQFRIFRWDTITIPTAFAFFSSVFPSIRVTEQRRGTIRVSPNWGVLNHFENAIELENIVCDTERTVEFSRLSVHSKQMIVEKLARFKILTADGLDDNQIPAAIGVFRNEYLADEDSNDTNYVNGRILMGLNDAREEEWRRSVYYERVNQDNERRYYIRLGVRPIIPRFNMQGTAVPQNVFTAGDWGELPLPLFTTHTLEQRGCAVAFVANMSYTHQKRLLALGLLQEEDPIINPRTIVHDPVENEPLEIYFDTGGRIIWENPLSTWLTQLNLPGLHRSHIQRRSTQSVAGSDFQFTVHEIDPPLAEQMFNTEYMYNEDYQFYIGIRIFVAGTPGGNRWGQHWVGVNELVMRNVDVTVTDPDTNVETTTPTPTLFYRISPTSAHEWTLGTGGNNNRGNIGWQVVENQEGRAPDIYVPLSEVLEYRIFQIPQNN